MAGRSSPASERAVSESAGVAILLAVTLLTTASVGVSVLVMDGDESAATTANFSFDYQSDQRSLLVTLEQGDSIPAGELEIVGETASVTWAAAANSTPNETVGPGSLVQLSEGSAWGVPVRRDQTIEIYHDPPEGNRTILDTWEGASP